MSMSPKAPAFSELEADDVYLATDEIRNRGGRNIRHAGTTIIAFVENPDGYPVELIGKK